MRVAPLGHAEKPQAPPLGFDEGWSKVVRKKNRNNHGEGRRLDVATNTWKISYVDTTSIFFTEFPETRGAKEMLRAFKFYGEAMEVVIPPKRDKRGKRFGFVRFNNVADPRLFAIQLDNIIIGATKIHVNLPKFHREKNTFGTSKEKQQRAVPIVKYLQPAMKHQQQSNLHLSRHGRSVPKPVQHSVQQNHRVTQVWKKKVDGGNDGRKVDVNSNDSGGKIRSNDTIPKVCFTVLAEEMQRFRKMYVGTVRTPSSSYSVHEWFGV